MSEFIVLQTVEQMSRVISNVGFPIGAFLLMYHYATKTLRANTEALTELNTEITRLRENGD